MATSEKRTTNKEKRLCHAFDYCSFPRITINSNETNAIHRHFISFYRQKSPNKVLCIAKY